MGYRLGLAPSVVLVVAILLRLVPYVGYPPAEAGYSAMRTAREANLLLRSSTAVDNSTRLTGFTAAAARTDSSEALLQAVAMSVLRWTGVSSQRQMNLYLRLFPFAGTLLLGISALAALSASASPLDPLKRDALFVLCFATLGSSVLLTLSHRAFTDAAFGWSFLLTYMAVDVRSASARSPWPWEVTRLLVAAAIVLIYHTLAIVFVLYLIMSAIIFRGLRNRRYLLFVLTVAFGFLTFLCFTRTVYLTSYVNLARHLLTARGPNRNQILSGYLAYSPDLLKRAVNLAVYSLVAFPVVLVVVNWLGVARHSTMHLRRARPLISYACTLLPLAALFYLFMGVPGLVNRIGEYGSVAAIAAVAIGLGTAIAANEGNSRRRWYRWSIYVSVAAAVTLSALGYLRSDIRAYVYTPGELLAAQVIAADVPQSEGIFTDFRLAGALAMDGHLFDNGVNDQDAPDVIKQELDSIYYTSRPTLALGALRRQFPLLSYAFVSSGMQAQRAGIKLYDHLVRGLTPEQYAKFASMPVVLTTGDSYVIWLK